MTLPDRVFDTKKRETVEVHVCTWETTGTQYVELSYASLGWNRKQSIEDFEKNLKEGIYSLVV